MLSASDAAERAVQHVTAMTGRAAESVIGIERRHPDGASRRPGPRSGPGRSADSDSGSGSGSESGGGGGERAGGGSGQDNGEQAPPDGCGGWCVIVEVVETRRIPDSADILATYQAEVDDDGELVSYRRLRRYNRGRTGAD
jgi:hypothetical protein